MSTLLALDAQKLDPEQVSDAVVAFGRLHAQSQLDLSPALRSFYEQIRRREPDRKRQEARLAAFDTIAAAAFTAEYREAEQQKDAWQRPAYTAFLALADQCEAGRAAALMSAIDPEEMRVLLARVENWESFPIEALEYALREGVVFPLPERALPVEVLDGLAARLTHGENMARQLALAVPESAADSFDLRSLYWSRSLTLAALHSFDWTLGEKNRPASAFARPAEKSPDSGCPQDTPETGLALLRAFARTEAAILPLLYTPHLLTEENAALLPPMHRWGLYCVWALDALDAGKPQEYLALLRRGLAACPGEKDTVQFLLDRFTEDTRPKASPELLMLAEKVRGILAACGADSPTAKAIRESNAYRQVAWLIEETPGSLPQ